MQPHEQAQFLRAVGIFIQQQINLAIVPLLETIRKLETQLNAPIDINKIIERLPVKEGPPGKDGENGRDGADCEMEAVMARVDKYIENVRPENGKDGKQGEQGPPGKDGADVVAAFRDSDRHLILTLSNGVTKDIGQIHGADGKDGMPGKDGKDGAPGLGIKELLITQEGERTFMFKHACDNGTVDEKTFAVPAMIYRGIWQQKDYEAGDVVTRGGSAFVALKATGTAPETKDCDWQLFVKRGRDGKDGEKGDPGDTGRAGRDGRDLTQMGFDGVKY